MIRRALFAVALMVLGCEVDNRVALGRFRVAASRMTNTCGPQASEFAPQFRFDVVVKVGDGLIHWAPINASEGTGSWNPTQHSFRVVQEADFVVTPTDTRRGILGCAGLGNYRQALQAKLGLPVVDPVQAGVAIACMNAELAYHGRSL